MAKISAILIEKEIFFKLLFYSYLISPIILYNNFKEKDCNL